MSYQVIARKWRPQSFHQLVGQEHVSTTILNALRNSRLPHALLFTGTRGVGKTSSARILAKSIRCQNAQDFTPCNQCNDCVEINQGSNVNVIEIDGASNNGVDAIRELRDSVGYMPSSGKHKIYIIDEVHMLSTNAFNALLKTLEEPPQHVIFIFATTEAQKIPVTVLSRCQRFDFRRISTKEIALHLEKICQEESISFEKEALWLISRQADGSMRDALSLLDQSINFCGTRINYAPLVEALGLTDRQLILSCLDAIVDKNSKKMLETTEKLRTQGTDIKNFCDELLEEIRNLLVLKVSGRDSLPHLIDLPDSELSLLEERARSLESEDIHILFDMALKGVNDVSKASNPLIVLEVLLIRLSQAPRIHQLIAQPASSASEEKKKPNQNQPTPVEPKKPLATLASCAYLNDLSLEANWQRFVEFCKKDQSILAAKLEHCVPLRLEKGKLSLGIRLKQDFLREQLQESSQKNKLISLIQSSQWLLSIESIDICSIKEDTQIDSLSPVEILQKKQEREKEELRKKIEDNPVVRRAKEVFNARITAVREKK